MFTVTVGYKNEQIENEPFEDEDDAQNCFDDAESCFCLEKFTGALIVLREDEIIIDMRKVEDKDKSDAKWRREMAMEAGMLHGIDAYNDMMGY